MTHTTLARITVKALVGSFLAATALTTSACKEEEKPTPKLFEEEGVWALTRHDPDGDGSPVDLDPKRDAKFLLKFDGVAKVVQTASCVFPGTTADPPGLTPGDTPCGFLDTGTEWRCQCFGYAFEEEEMRWVEFTAGDTPPMVTLIPTDATDAGGGAASTGDGGTTGAAQGGSESGGGDAGDGTLVRVSEIPDVNFTYTFAPLPDGVFDSNGTTSRFVMQARGASVFDTVLDDPMRMSCEPCVAPVAP